MGDSRGQGKGQEKGREQWVGQVPQEVKAMRVGIIECQREEELTRQDEGVHTYWPQKGSQKGWGMNEVICGGSC